MASTEDPTSEDQLNADLQTYQDQLAAISECIELSQDANVTELLEIKNDLQQLVSITKDRILEVTKKRLLQTLHEEEKASAQELENTEMEDTVSLEHCEDLKGIKCQAPIKESWGTASYHNAMIFNRLEGGNETEFDVSVLFTHPCYSFMRTCPFFLEGRCKFTSENCRYSHGHIVSFSDLKPYYEPDYSKISVGTRCFVKQDDELWHEANICSIEDEVVVVKFVVQLPHANNKVTIDNILPFEGNSSDESESSDDEETYEDEKDTELTVVRQLGEQSVGAIGEWEKYTKGIGSKLMAKMGYVTGQGLGKSSDGRLEPVKIEILPPGKSLDACAAIKESKKNSTSAGKTAGKKRLKGSKEPKSETKVTDTFDFLNSSISRSNSQIVSAPVVPVKEDLKGDLNVKLFTVQEDLKALDKKLVSLNQSMERNNGKDRAIVNHITEKISKVQKQRQGLKNEEKRILSKMQQKSSKKKLAIF